MIRSVIHAVSVLLFVVSQSNVQAVADVSREDSALRSTAPSTAVHTSAKQPGALSTTSPAAALVEPVLKNIFDEPIDSGALKRFMMISPGRFNLEPGKLELFPGPEKSSQIWLRPVHVGPVARLTAKIAFPALDDKEGITETRVGFVLKNGKTVSVALARKRLAGKVNGVIRLMENNGSEKTIREFPFSDDLPSGEWKIYYHHGLIRAACGESLKVQGFSDVKPDTCPIVGVVFSQNSGSTSYGRLRFHASDLSLHAVGAKKQDIQDAIGASREANRSFRDGNLESAYNQATKALRFWKKALGEEDPDVANAWFNLAMVCGARNDNDGALKSYSKALSIREKTLGKGHPLTALAHLKMAEVLVALDKREEARSHMEKASPILESVYGITRGSRELDSDIERKKEKRKGVEEPVSDSASRQNMSGQ